VEFGTPIRFLGPSRAWNPFRNAVGDACALVRRSAFEAVGGFTERYRVGLDDLELFNRFIARGFRVAHYPDPVFLSRIGETTMKSRNRSPEEGRFRAIEPYLEGMTAEERALFLYAVGGRLDLGARGAGGRGLGARVGALASRVRRALRL
jgi:hypothetical protein